MTKKLLLGTSSMTTCLTTTAIRLQKRTAGIDYSRIYSFVRRTSFRPSRNWCPNPMIHQSAYWYVSRDQTHYQSSHSRSPGGRNRKIPHAARKSPMGHLKADSNQSCHDSTGSTRQSLYRTFWMRFLYSATEMWTEISASAYSPLPP